MKIKCTICGKEKFVTNLRLAKLTLRFGSSRLLLENYRCMACRPVDAEICTNSKKPTTKEEMNLLLAKVRDIRLRERNPINWFAEKKNEKV